MRTISAIDIIANIKEKEDREGIQYSQEEKVAMIVNALRNDVKPSKIKDGKR